MRRAVVFAILVTAIARPAAAHQTSIKYVDLITAGDHAEVSIKVSPGDVTEPMRLPPDAKPTAAEAAMAPAVAPYVAAWLQIAQPTATGESACISGAPATQVDDDGFVVVAWRIACPQPIELVTLDLGRLFALDKRQEAIVQLRADAEDFTPVVVRVGDSPITLRARARSTARSLHAGMTAFYKSDHVGFVLVILLAVMLGPKRDGRAWQLASTTEALHAAMISLAAFTLSHLVAVLAVALGWIALPAPLVAVLTTISIAYLGAETIVRPDARWRVAVMFGFGLAHGLGLAIDLPQRDTIWSNTLFCAGIELAQLTVVLIALPLIRGLAIRLGVERYRRLALPALAVAIAVVGVARLVVLAPT